MTAVPGTIPGAAARRRRRDSLGRAFSAAAAGSLLISLAVLVVLLADVFMDGFSSLNWELLTRFPSRHAELAGLKAAIYGSVMMMMVTAVVSLPIGIGAAIYLEEYASDNWIRRIVEVNIANLAGVPSIIYGLLGLELFVRAMYPITNGRSVLSGGLMMGLLVMPIVIISSQEALRAVPQSIRHAAYGVGATQWQTIRDHVLPLAFPGVLTGTILAFSRAIGETAPLITIGALTFLAFTPDNLRDPFTVLPIQIFNWISRPQPEFHARAAAGIIVLLVVLLSMNAVAVFLRWKYRRPAGL